MEKEKKKTAIIYTRVSSQEQIQGTSLDSQERHCKEFAERKGIDVKKVFREEGESAKTADRTELTRALAFCSETKNSIDYFIVWKLDRFARSQKDHITIKAVLETYKVRLLSATEPIDNSPTGLFLEQIIAAASEFDNNVKSERTKSGMLERVKQGFWVWQSPLGYYRPRDSKNIAPDPKKAPYIKKLFEEYSKGIYTYLALSKKMTEEGFTTKHGKKPTAQLIQKIIKNPIYCGVINVWGEHEGSFEAIISKELYDKCQAIAEGKSIDYPARTTTNPEFPLRRLIVCEECGKALTGSSPKGRSKNYSYYHHYNTGCDSACNIPKEDFEQKFIEYLDSITPDLKYEKAFKAVVIDIWKNNYSILDKKQKQVKKKISLLMDDRQKVFDFHRKGDYTDEEFTEQKRLINEKISIQRQKLNELVVEELDMESALEHCFNFVRNTSKAWVEADHKIKIRLQRQMFESRIKFDGEKFGTASLSLVYRINQEWNGKKSNLVTPPGFEPGLPG